MYSTVGSTTPMSRFLFFFWKTTFSEIYVNYFHGIGPFGIGDVFLCKASTVLVEGIPEEYQSDEKAGMDP